MLKGSVAFVAGSSRGIGKAIARSFLQEGARVAISGRREEELARTATEFRSEFGVESLAEIVGDLTEPKVIRDALQKVSAKWGRLDAVIANIGSGSAKNGWNLSADDWQEVFDLNFFSTTRLLNEAIPYLEKSGKGSAIIISSIAGVEAMGAPLTYSCAKAALLSYGKNLSRLVAPLGIRINVVAPGNILFEGGSWEKRAKDRPEEVASYIQSMVPLARFGRPEEIADFVVFLSSSRASFSTGACVVVDGGQTRAI
jgi:3-oxoacyl-[acyl-carrier protein] reductase